MADPTDIFQWRRVDARLTTSGQPSEDQLAAIAVLGVRHVVNLGMHDHPKALPDEPASVAALGMTYTHIPVDFAAPTEADLVTFAATMAALEGETVHVHCIANLRVTAFLYRWGRVPEPRSLLDSVWRPGGVWARFIGHGARTGAEHQYAGRDY